MIFNHYSGFGADDPASLPVLKLGATGPYVVKARSLLESHGYSAPGDPNIFGPIMMGATQGFQKAKGLAVDGVIGVNTWSALLGVPVPYPKINQNVPAPGSDGAWTPPGEMVGPPAPMAKKSILPWVLGAGALALKLFVF